MLDKVFYLCLPNTLVYSDGEASDCNALVDVRQTFFLGKFGVEGKLFCLGHFSLNFPRFFNVPGKVKVPAVEKGLTACIKNMVH